MVESRRDVGPDEQLTKVGHAKDSTKSGNCLFQDLATVRDKEKTRSPLLALEESTKVKSGYDSLPGPGRCNYEIP